MLDLILVYLIRKCYDSAASALCNLEFSDYTSSTGETELTQYIA